MLRVIAGEAKSAHQVSRCPEVTTPQKQCQNLEIALPLGTESIAT